MDYYEGNESQVLLNKGISLAKRFSDKLTEGKILNNIGFEYLRCANYEEADKSFKKSILTLEGIQPHEQVYPYSNLAVLHMISKNWEEALNDIAEALFWNKSSYASLVLKTNRMLCYYFSDNPLWNNIYIELFDYINSNHYIDDKIYKKICINLALVALKNKQSDEAAQLLDYCLPHLKAEWPHARYRFLKMKQDLTGELQSLTLPPNPCYNDYYCKIEFEPWLVNFSHD